MTLNRYQDRCRGQGRCSGRARGVAGARDVAVARTCDVAWNAATSEIRETPDVNIIGHRPREVYTGICVKNPPPIVSVVD